MQPLWTPDNERIDQANISRFLHMLRSEIDPLITDYHSLYQFSVNQPADFWQALWEFSDIIGDCGSSIFEPADKMQDARWFPEAKLNFAENLLRHRDDRVAIRFRSENGSSSEYTYKQLFLAVAATAAGLKQCGVVSGDRVAGYLPNLAETVIAMLATTSLGAIWSSTSPDFGINGVLDRFGQITPKVLFTANAYCYNGKVFDCLSKARQVAAEIDSIEQVVVIPYIEQDISRDGFDNVSLWEDFLDHSVSEIDFQRDSFDLPLYIMYSSGTTGVPKCITHGSGGTLLQHLKELALHTDLHRDDSIFYFTTCGWMMWNWLVSSLATGATVVLYDGSPFYPHPAAMFDLIDKLDISIFGTSAKSISAWDKAGIKPRQSHRLSALKTILSTGSPLAPESFDYVYREIKSDVCLSSISGGTDIISCFALGCPILPVWRGELQCRGLGMQVEIRDDKGAVVIDKTGELTCSASFPAMPVGFWGDTDGSKYQSAYFEQYQNIWSQGDYARLTLHGGLIIYGRSDTTLNPGGVRIGTAEIYNQLEKLDEVLESLCIGQQWQDDIRLVLFVRLSDELQLDEQLRDKIRKTIRSNTTPRHVPEKIIQVAALPRTISGKLVELAVNNVVHGHPVKNIDALANPESLELFRDLAELRR
ncbi:MAG: acetoacetate--CoA ligase [Xanthomonadales bacterium]|nr:acetoacetate--CoA ligase [Xanthomonadales bacterium]